MDISQSARRVLEDVVENREQESEDEGEPNAFAVTTSVVGIILFLILLTIAFEEGKHRILHAATKNTQPIIQSLFGELTVLGFLSLFTFCVTRMGEFERLSVRIFGQQEEQELLEIFELVHYMLFGVMVFFVVSVLGVVHGTKKTEEDWFLMDLACRSADHVRGVADKLHAAQKMASAQKESTTSWFSYLLHTCTSTNSSNFYVDLGLFAGIRNEFLLDRALVPPFDPAENTGLDQDFNFSSYLSHSLGHNLAHIVELEDKTWLFLGLLTILYYVVLTLTNCKMHIFAWIWIGSGWVLFLFRNYFDYHILNILYDMSSPVSLAHLQDGTKRDYDGEKTPLFPSNSRLPSWTEIGEERLPSDSNRSVGKKLTRQDVLFWGGRNGPEVYRLVNQIHFLCSSAYVTLLLLTFYPYMFQERPLPTAIIYIVLSLLPFLFLIMTLRRSAAHVTMVCSIGVHRMPQTIAQVLREEKTDRVVRSLVLMQKLQYLAGSSEGFTKTPTATAVLSLSQEIELLFAKKTFHAMDTSGNGQIEVTELRTLMDRLGSPVTDSSFQAIVMLLDPNGDGIITLEEFTLFYQQNVLLHEDKNERATNNIMKELAHQIFHQFDKDNTHSITLSEFKAVLETFNVDFTIDEMGQLLNEIDHDNTGSIGVHEFEDLLENHRYLFRSYHLPPLPLGL
ncbi:EF hand domain containing protein [Nitzschia inconspicua]|uniref:EF hand domain containing protein n=1 Tax=Nitzschia inconspicua TaxID=303405 RepID=A0A9K3LQY9_9STRA|nr:EF hand domain containing protein [Nitzschia inconspicua]